MALPKKSITNDDVAAFNAYCKSLSKGWVRNRLMEKPFNSINNGVKFAVIVPDFQNHQIILKGSFTWGNSGFTFLLKTNGNRENQPMLNITRHQNCTIDEDLINECITEIIKIGKEKVAGREQVQREGFKEPMLKVYKRSPKISQISRENIEDFRNNGTFDREFSTFLLQHEADGIRCCRSRKNN